MAMTTTPTRGITTMTSPEQSLYILQTWFSPSYPVGAYTYSHGLENAFETGLVTNVDQAVQWIGQIVASGNGFADAVFVSQCFKATSDNNETRLKDIAEYAIAFCGTAELRLETSAQGAAFIDVVQKVEPNAGLDVLCKIWPGPYAYPAAIGAAAGALAINRPSVIAAFLHGFVANLSSALVRAIPLGQTDGQRIIARLAPVVARSAAKADTIDYHDLTTSTLMVDLCSMQHESQYTRLFRS
jgi:urease accessory protein